jgi:hypothetical protein
LKQETKGRPGARFRFNPDTAAVPLDDLFADSEANPGPRIPRTGMQPLKYDENSFGMFRFNANTIVGYSKQPFSFMAFHAHVNFNRLFAAKLNRVANEVLKQL